MATGFDGFPEEMFRFLRELKKHNDRDWFNANKERYKTHVVAPMVSFIEAMDGRLARVSDCFLADARPNGGSMFRIYRDTRFSKDKSPYKEHVACHFRHMSGKDAHAPGFYVHLEPGDVFFGGGIWHAPPPVLIRSARRSSTRPTTGSGRRGASRFAIVSAAWRETACKGPRKVSKPTIRSSMISSARTISGSSASM